MTKCEFCPKFFTPRPETKKARACNNRECQRKRQRLNEKEWRISHKAECGDSGAQYYRAYRSKRLEFFVGLVERILKALRVGCTFLHESFSVDEFQEFLIRFLTQLGIRRANKLCPPWRCLIGKAAEGTSTDK
jgi:hypothetical protein